MKVSCILKKELFFNPINGYRVVSAIPSLEEDTPEELTLNSYGNFTISGSNLTNLKLGEKYNLDLRENKVAKYPNSYVMLGYGDIDIGETITVAPSEEYHFLCQFMEPIQAQRVNDAYPDFVQKILNGQEDELDYKNIFNVGPVRFEAYVNDIKAHFHSIFFCPIAQEWGIKDFEKIEKLAEVFATPEELKEELEKNPYHVFFDLLNYPFNKTDRIILGKNPNLLDSLERCEYGCLEILRQNELEGDTCINAELLKELALDIVPETVNHIKEAVEQSDRIYYDETTGYSSNKHTYEAEVNIANNILNRIKNPVSLPMDWNQYTTVDGFTCTEEQAKILKLATEQSVCLLRGYSGTGKSTVMKALVLMLEHYHYDYVMLAPTGKAAARLRETTGRDAYTIHMYKARQEEISLHPDYVIVDECSMVGVELMSILMDILPETTKLVFVCDEAQLASISCGNVIQDLIDSGIIPQTSLTKVFRYGSSGLATIATDTRNGELGPRTEGNNFSDYQFIPITQKPLQQILKVYENLLSEGYTKEDIMILCPYNKSSFGTYRINEAIQSRYNSHVDTSAKYEIKSEGIVIKFKVGDKVINTHNNYSALTFDYNESGDLVESKRTVAVMNGDIGYVRYVKETDKGPIMIVDFNGELVKIHGGAIGDLLLGYAISIHKSQGSQSKAVIMVTAKNHKRMLTRNLLYVGNSRAQEKLIEIGDTEAIQEGLEKQENKEKDTWLKNLLIEGRNK